MKTKLIILLIAFSTYSCENKECKLKIGQTWIYCYGDKDNPFEEDNNCREMKIINLSEKYVQYIYDGDTSSLRKKTFVSGAEMIDSE